MASPWDNYNPPLLTEQLLSAHNKIMEKKMIDSYKEGKRGDLKFLKNKLRRAAHHQAMKKAHSHHPWKHVNDKVHKTLNPRPAVNPAVVDPQASTIQLWPPFSVANRVAATLPIQVRPTHSQPLTTMLSSTAQVASSHQQQHQQLQRPNLTEGQSSAAAGSTQAMYSNLIPAYYIPPHISSNQKPTGGYFVSVPTIFGQWSATSSSPDFPRTLSSHGSWPASRKLQRYTIANAGSRPHRWLLFESRSRSSGRPSRSSSYQPSSSNQSGSTKYLLVH